jgi:hypothetical protein
MILAQETKSLKPSQLGLDALEIVPATVGTKCFLEIKSAKMLYNLVGWIVGILVQRVGLLWCIYYAPIFSSLLVLCFMALYN